MPTSNGVTCPMYCMGCISPTFKDIYHRKKEKLQGKKKRMIKGLTSNPPQSFYFNFISNGSKRICSGPVFRGVAKGGYLGGATFYSSAHFCRVKDGIFVLTLLPFCNSCNILIFHVELLKYGTRVLTLKQKRIKVAFKSIHLLITSLKK